MKNQCRFLVVIAACLLAACGTMQSIVRSTIPYTTALTVKASAQTGQNLTALGAATSFDNIIFKNGENTNRINAVKVISAELRSTLPADFDLGQIKTLKIFMMKADESTAVLVASKENIPADVGSLITLDANTSGFLDPFIRDADIRIKMIYTLRNQVKADANLLLVLNLSAMPVNNK